MRVKTALSRRALPLLTLSAVLWCVSGAAGARQKEPPLITPVLGNAYELSGAADSYEARVPVTLRPNVQPGDVKLTKVYVEFNGRQDNQLMGAFEVKWEVGAPGHAPTIIVTAHLDVAKEQGAYVFAVNAAHGNEPAQALTFKLTRPAAKLSAPATLVVEQVQPLFADNYDVRPEFTLREAGGRSRLSDLSITQTEAHTGKDAPVQQKLRFDVPAGGIPPSQRVPVPYSTSGEFPLGSTKGSVEIASSQLAEPVTFNYEVRARRGRGVIWLLLAAGLVVGYLIRTKLEQLIALGESQAKGLELRGRILAAKEKHKDRTFAEGVAATLGRLDAVLLKKSGLELLWTKEAALNLDTATKAAAAEFDAAQKNLQARREAARGNYEALSGLLEKAWSLPAGVAGAVATAKEGAARVHAALEDDNVTESEERMAHVRKDLAARLTTAAAAWRDEAAPLLDKLTAQGSALSGALPGGMGQAATNLKAVIDGARLAPGDTSIAGMQALLEAVHKSREGIRELRAGYWLKDYAEKVVSTLRRTKIKDEATLASLNQKVAAAAADLDRAADEPGRVSEVLQRDLDELDKTFRAAVVAQIPGAATAEEKGGVSASLNNFEYLKAARSVLGIHQRIAAAEGIILGDQPKPAAGAGGAPAAAGWTLPGAPTAAPLALLLSTRADERLRTPEDLRVRAFWGLLGATLLRTVFLGLAIAGVGYFLFAETFVGTAKELVAVFFWAFSLDVSTAVLLQKIPAITGKS
ncbi:MAG TPA: hypothetical protein VF586_21320 [Pyrinomonadaceae bacterium]